MHKGFCFAGLASSLLLVVGCAAQGGDVSTDDEGTVGGDALTSVACLPNTTCPSYVDWGIDAAGQTRGAYPSISLSTPDFDYAPTAMYDGVYKAWWCAAGGIHYATAPSLDGPWTQSGVVLAPSRVQGSFDRDDVCDPSVVRVDGTYYMYYGANNYTDASGPYYYTTNIGVASSPDGVHWTRMNGGRPIVVAHRGGRCTNPNVDACSYGAGQPSVVFSRDSGP
ncbi:MAG TPA: hypothetical protein VHB21_19825, partial [Minicystis sp.]|nr:hypothetical protein [Minicystis sp.]